MAAATVRVSTDGRTVPVDKDAFTVGRSKECDLRLDYRLVSATHVRLLRSAAGNYFAHDCSSNGTSVNDVRLRKGQRAPLVDGDVLHLVKMRRAADRNVSLTFNVAAAPLADATQRLSESEDEAAVRTVSVSPADGEAAATMPLPLEEAEAEPAAKVPRMERVATQINKALSQQQPAAAGPSAPAANGAGNAAADAADESLVATLSCSICQDVFHRCVTLTPCSHKFCAGCFSDCLRRSTRCPMCRVKAQSVGRDHTCDAVVDNLLERRPDLRRPPADTAALDAKSAIDNDAKTVAELRAALRGGAGAAVPRRRVRSEEEDDDEEDEEGEQPDEEDEDEMEEEEEEETDESDYDDDDDNAGGADCCAPPRANVRAAHCRQCPGRLLGRLGTQAVVAYVCPPNGGHVLCQCCMQPVPAGADKKLTRCSVCSIAYCHAYWTCRPCRSLATGGCINRLADLPPYMSAVINGNAYESQLLIAHLREQQLTDDLFQRQLLAGVRAAPLVSLRHFGGRALDADARVCRPCADLVWSDLAFDYCLKNGVKGRFNCASQERADCWYGRNCRTQKHNAQHAARLNHICEQTKFH